MILKDNIAIVTGAGPGSGRSGARILARESARVVVSEIVDRRTRPAMSETETGYVAFAAKVRARCEGIFQGCR